MCQHVYVNVGRSSYRVTRDGRVLLSSKGEEREIKAGKTVAIARRLADNLFAIRDSAARRAA